MSSFKANKPQLIYSTGNGSDKSDGNCIAGAGESNHSAILLPSCTVDNSSHRWLNRNTGRSTNRAAATILRGVDEPVYVTSLGPNDILLGRGRPSVDYEGNLRFRALVNSRLHEYDDSGRKGSKDDVAKRVVEEIERLGGRFLRRAETATASTTLSTLSGFSENPDDEHRKPPASVYHAPVAILYELAEYDVAIEKVKQTFRDAIHAKRKSEGNLDCGVTGSTTIDRTANTTVLLETHQYHPQLQDLDFPPRSSMVGNNINNFGIMNTLDELTRNQRLQLLSLQAQHSLTNDGISIVNPQYRMQQQEQHFDDLNTLLGQNHRLNMYPSRATAVLDGFSHVGTNLTVDDLFKMRAQENLLAAVRLSVSCNNPTNRTSTAAIEPWLSNYGVIHRNFPTAESFRSAALSLSLLTQQQPSSGVSLVRGNSDHISSYVPMMSQSLFAAAVPSPESTLPKDSQSNLLIRALSGTTNDDGSNCEVKRSSSTLLTNETSNCEEEESVLVRASRRKKSKNHE